MTPFVLFGSMALLLAIGVPISGYLSTGMVD